MDSFITCVEYKFRKYFINHNRKRKCNSCISSNVVFKLSSRTLIISDNRFLIFSNYTWLISSLLGQSHDLSAFFSSYIPFLFSSSEHFSTRMVHFFPITHLSKNYTFRYRLPPYQTYLKTVLNSYTRHFNHPVKINMYINI